jgi:hypothetical protein
VPACCIFCKDSMMIISKGAKCVAFIVKNLGVCLGSQLSWAGLFAVTEEQLVFEFVLVLYRFTFWVVLYTLRLFYFLNVFNNTFRFLTLHNVVFVWIVLLGFVHLNGINTLLVHLNHTNTELSAAARLFQYQRQCYGKPTTRLCRELRDSTNVHKINTGWI